MVYLFLKEIAESTDSSNVIIVTQSLVKDTFCDVSLYKGNAIRVLSKIVDSNMLNQMERYFKQALVEKDEFVSSATLLSLLLLSTKPGCSDVIARWSSEIQTVLSSSKADMVQFHALALLRTVKKADKLAVSKVVLTLMKSNIRAPLAICLLIRYATNLLLSSDAPAATVQACYDFLESSLHHKSEIVAYEAARALVTHPTILASGRDLGSAITVLQVMLNSPKPGQRYAAVRTLSKLASSHPAAVAKCNEELESLLLNDSNRVIGTLAITALLKTGSETNVDRLIKQIASFMVDAGADELKVTVVQAIHELALRTPTKHKSIMTFLSNALRDEGGYEFKKAILDALLDIMEAIPDSKTDGLLHCCEFIEDCEFTALATRVLHLLGKEGPSLTAPQPAMFIRHIYNRVILENAPVRASAVSALAKFASRCEELRPQIIPLLQRCTDDDDDEVRDRAVMSLRLLGAQVVLGTTSSTSSAVNGSSKTGSNSNISSTVQFGGLLGSSSTESTSTSVLSMEVTPLSPTELVISRDLTSGALPLPVHALSKALKLYQARPAPGAFSFNTLPHVDISGSVTSEAEGYGYNSEIRAIEAASVQSSIAARTRTRGPATTTSATAAADTSASNTNTGTSSASASSSASVSGEDSSAADSLYKIPEFVSFGPLFRSSRPVELTERELEYLATVQKHIFAKHVVLAFTITNTVPEVLLERVVARVAPSDTSVYRVVATLSCPRIREGSPGICYVALARNPDAGMDSISISSELRFHYRDCDPSHNYEPTGDPTPEDYPLNDFDIGPADYIAKVPITDFRAGWEALGNESEQKGQFVLPFKTVVEAVNATIDTLGLAPCEGTSTVKAGTNKHQAYLAGVFLGGTKVLARIAVTLDAETGCVLNLGIRSEEPAVAELLMSVIG